MSSDDDCPWASDESKEQRATGKMSKVFTIDNDEYSDLEEMRGKLLKFATEVNRVVNEDGKFILTHWGGKICVV